MGFKEKNRDDRIAFVERWAEFVRTHDDKDWSRQQNIIIDSQIKSSTMTRDEYLKMKSKEHNEDSQ